MSHAPSSGLTRPERLCVRDELAELNSGGKLDFAYKYFLKTAKIDLEAKYKVYVGTVFMGGSHPAANGGAWMTAVFGFGGVHADDKQLVINPRLFAQWKSLQFHLAYKGDAFQIKITKTSSAPSRRIAPTSVSTPSSWPEPARSVFPVSRQRSNTGRPKPADPKHLFLPALGESPEKCRSLPAHDPDVSAPSASVYC